jgi:hypothetical protein
MKIGDLVIIFCPGDGESIGAGIYLGVGSRGTKRIRDNQLFSFWYNGRVTTFDKPYWEFEVIA